MADLLPFEPRPVRPYITRTNERQGMNRESSSGPQVTFSY